MCDNGLQVYLGTYHSFQVVALELVWVATLVLEPQAKRGQHLQWDLLHLIMPLLMHEVPEIPELNQAALQGRDINSISWTEEV